MKSMFSMSAGAISGSFYVRHGSGAYSYSTRAIFFLCDWLKVLRIHAASDATQMVKVFPCRYISNKMLVGNTVSGQQMTTPGANLAVPLSTQRSGEQPAAGKRLQRNLVHQAINDCFCGFSSPWHLISLHPNCLCTLPLISELELKCK